MDEDNFFTKLEAIDKSVAEARYRVWQEWMQKETDRWESYTRRLWEDGRPKEPAVIAQDAIEWETEGQDKDADKE